MDLCFVFLAICVLFSPVHPLSKPIGDPISAIEGLVQRILGESYVGKFEHQVIPDEKGKDVFEIDADQQAKKPVLRGNNGVSLASALNFYLKYSCNCAIH